MSDIWHRYDETPKRLDIIMTDTGCWAYRDDLLALETGNKDLSDKIGKLETELEKTRKALDIATNAIKSAKDHNVVNCITRGVSLSIDDVHITLFKALEQITAITKGDENVSE